MALFRLLTRTAFGAIFFTGGWGALTDPRRRTELVRRTLSLPEPELMVRLNGAGMLAGGGALALGIKPRAAALWLALILAPTTYVGHQFWAQEDDTARRGQVVHFSKNVSLIGALLTYAVGGDD